MKRMKRQTTEWKKVFATYMTNKGLVSKLHEESLRISGEKADHPFFSKWAKNLKTLYKRRNVNVQ